MKQQTYIFTLLSVLLESVFISIDIICGSSNVVSSEFGLRQWWLSFQSSYNSTSSVPATVYTHCIFKI
jgi:hypothetical protein